MKTSKFTSTPTRNARVEEIDGHSRYIIMSDCHRGDGLVSDEFLKNKNVFLAATEH